MQSSGKEAEERIILPGQTIGILGGGQLGRMMILAGRAMGYKFITLDPVEDSPAGQVSDLQVVSEYSSIQAAEQLARNSSVVTYEFENVDANVTHFLEERTYVPQGSQLLFLTQHRLREKEAVTAAGVQVAPYRPVRTREELLQALRDLGSPAVLKTCFGGYDGKGQWLLRSEDDAQAAWSEIAAAHPHAGSTSGEAQGDAWAPFVLEKFIPFERELSVIVARSPRGEIKTFPVAENVHRNHILHLSIVPARVSSEVRQKAQEMAFAVAKQLNLVGVMGVEMFLLADGTLFVNELAPRPHNSGHYTMDACATSQFEQHIRCICNLPLGDTRLWTPVVMVNILGEHVAPILAKLPELPNHMKVHLYDKAEVREKRKMGHMNVTADSVEDAIRDIAKLGIWEDFA